MKRALYKCGIFLLLFIKLANLEHVIGLLTKRVSKKSPHLQRLARKIQFSLVLSLDIILSNKRLSKARINLLVYCVVVRSPQDRFPCVEANIKH